MHYFVDEAGRYLGAFDGVEPPDGATEVPDAPGHAHDVWDAHTGEWEVSLSDLKGAKLAEINAACDAALDAFQTTYPAGEVQSWDQQVAEAQALHADAEASAPLVRAIAAARGLDLAELCVRITANATAWATMAGQVIGQRQALEDQLEAAASPADVAALNVNIIMPD